MVSTTSDFVKETRRGRTCLRSWFEFVFAMGAIAENGIDIRSLIGEGETVADDIGAEKWIEMSLDFEFWHIVSIGFDVMY